MTRDWIVYPRAGDSSALWLFCFPYSGAGPQIYYPWSKELQPDIEIAAVQLPGHGTRLHEMPFDDLRPLVASLCNALTPHLTKPFAFFGHSFGALLCFEAARQLRRNALPGPRHIFVAGRQAPHIKAGGGSVQNLGNGEFIEMLRRLKGTPDAVLQNEELLAMFLPAIRADFSMSETYVYTDENQLACPISAFGGVDDEWVSHEEIEGWKTHTAAAFKSHMFPGNHFFIHGAQSQIIQTIRSELFASESRLQGLSPSL